jgi:ABC-type antimicrobial peptide transport system permease subunit
MELAVRVARDPGGIAAELRRQLAAIDPALPVFPVRTLEADMDAALMRERMLALLSSAFGGLAGLLAAIGLYGVVDYSVRQRAQEIGVRMALGAQPGRVLQLIIGETLALAGIGILLGLPAALAATGLVGGFLYGVKPGDPVVLAAAVGLLTITAVGAGWIPAWRASRIEPTRALREE